MQVSAHFTILPAPGAIVPSATALRAFIPHLLRSGACHFALCWKLGQGLCLPCSKAHGALCRVVPKPSGGLPLALQLQSAGLRTSAAQQAEHTVKVPSMGDSITEGTVASVAKQEGELCSMGDSKALSMARCRCSASSARIFTGEHAQAQLLHAVQFRLEFTIVQVH